MDLADARIAVRTLLRDHAMHLEDDSVLDLWLERGQKDTASYTYCYQRFGTFAQSDGTEALIPGMRKYDPTGTVGAGGLGLTDFLWPLHMTWNAVPLLRWTGLQTGLTDANSSGAGTPRFYQTFSGDVFLVPYPTTAVLDTYRLQLVYAALPGAWTSGSGVLQVGPDTGPIWFAASRVAMERRRWTQAGLWYREYWDVITRVRMQQLQQFAQTKAEQETSLRSNRRDETHRLQLEARARALLRSAQRRRRAQQ